MVGRIISEDDDWILLEVPKHTTAKWTLSEDKASNRFETFVFSYGIPWERKTTGEK